MCHHVAPLLNHAIALSRHSVQVLDDLTQGLNQTADGESVLLPDILTPGTDTSLSERDV